MKFRFCHDHGIRWGDHRMEFGPAGSPDWAAHFGRFDKHRRDAWGGGDTRRTRMFEQGDLRFVILKLLASKPAHGYEIIRAVEQQFGGVYAPSPGIVYPTLTLLEEEGFIEVVETNGSRKLYGLTATGRTELERVKMDVERVFARMQEYRRRYGGGPAPEILRAMENLQTALRLRLDRSNGDDTQKITSILDAAARSIEES